MTLSTVLPCQLFFPQLCQELPEKRRHHPDTEMLSIQVKWLLLHSLKSDLGFLSNILLQFDITKKITAINLWSCAEFFQGMGKD
jgi:hypothetical protein